MWKWDACNSATGSSSCGSFPSVPLRSRLETLASGDLVALSGDGNCEDLSIRLREAVMHGHTL